MPRCPPSHHGRGRVRRLVLDGAVARQHAAQRQQAIERLEQRLLENQAEHKELWEKRSAGEPAPRRRGTAASSRRRSAPTAASSRHRSAPERRLVRDLAEINQRTRRTHLRVESAVQAVTLRSARRALRRWARRSARLGEANIVKPGKRIAGAVRGWPSRAKHARRPRRTFSREATAGPRPRRPAPRSYRSARACTSRRRANGASRSAPKASGEKGSAPGTRAAARHDTEELAAELREAGRRDSSRTRAVAHLHGRDTGLGPTRWYGGRQRISGASCECVDAARAGEPVAGLGPLGGRRGVAHRATGGETLRGIPAPGRAGTGRTVVRAGVWRCEGM